MKKQPDFTKVFHDHFGKTPAKVTYGIRRDANETHDVVFLSSLIHDAIFRRKDVVLRNKRLVMPIVRDCWELGLLDRDGSKELHVAQSRLIVSPVAKMRWSFAHPADFRPEDELMICDIRLERQAVKPGECVSLILGGFTWQCAMTVSDSDLMVRLQDMETPYLHSERKGKKP
jgi:hypothetical protein